MTSTVLFNNNAPSWGFAYLSYGGRVINTGRIPSLDSEGTADSYRVTGFQVGYCTKSVVGPGIAIQARWYNQYSSCQDPLGEEGYEGPAVPIGGDLVTGLPGTTAVGVESCWIVTVDFSGSGLEFTIGGDADGVFDDVLPWDGQDLFGYEFQFPGIPPDSLTGLMLAGDPFNAPFGAGTDPAWGFPPGPFGTGLGERDEYYYDGPNFNSGCYWFGGYGKNQWAGFHHQLYGVTLDGECAGAGGIVCTSSAFSSGVSRLNASAPLVSIAFDDLVLAADRLPATPPQPGIFIAGPTTAQIPFFDGTLCINLVGLQRFATVTFPNAAGIAVEPVSLATSAAGGLNVMANMTHYFQRWNRDPAAGGAGANFSEAIGICFVP